MKTETKSREIVEGLFAAAFDCQCKFLGYVQVTHRTLRQCIASNAEPESICEVPEGKYILVAEFGKENGRFIELRVIPFTTESLSVPTKIKGMTNKSR
jgi:hypothetical protein